MYIKIYSKKFGPPKKANSLLALLLILGSLLLPLSAMAQSFMVKGTVKSGDGTETMPGVNVLIKGTTQGTATDIDGNFSIEVPSSDAVLVFSFIGFKQQEVRVGNMTTLSITMEPDMSNLSEVIVVGYGTQERAKVTGAISSVGSEAIRALPVPNLASAIQGRAAGVQVTNAGAPGTDPIVRVRGIGTVGNNDPLYVIDGVPAGGLNQINPADIESIEVLKDASAAAIYGSRAANGVILVTTKKGVIGKPKVTLDSYYGTQQAWKQLDLLNSDQYIAFGRELLANGNQPAPQRFDNLGDLANVETDWQGEMFRSAPIQDHNLAISGGTESVLYNVSLGYFSQEGIMKGTDFERISFRSNTDFKINKYVSFGQTLTFAYSNRNNEPFTGGRSQLEHIVKQVPYIPVRDETRLGGFRAPDRVDGSDPENPVLNAELRTNRQQDFKILGTAYIDVMPFEGFKYRFLAGIDIGIGTNDQYTPRFFAGDFNNQPFATIAQTRSTFVSPLFSNQFSYGKTINKHSFDVLAVIEQQAFRSTNLSGSGQNNLTNDVRVLQGVQNQVTSGSQTDYALISYIGRINYDYDQKYLFSASVRRDGGSRFGPGNKWGTFPSVSVGWRLSQETFMQSLTAISDLKIRASYGETGNDRIGDYVYQGTIDSNLFYNFNGSLQGGSTISSLANADLRWESTIMKNIGMDLGLFNDRFNLSFEYFDNKTEGMILGVPIPPSLGFDGAPVANVGTVRNNGLEFTLGYRKYTGDFQFSIDGNMGFVNNELVSLGSGNTIFGPAFNGDPYTFTEEGQPIAYFYGWIADGIYQTGESTSAQPNAAAGDIKFRDINNDGIINANDRTNLGHYLPDFTYGVNFNGSYKNFDFTMFLQGVQGNEIFNNLRFHTEGMTRLFNASTVVLDRWTPNNTNTNVPRAVSGDPNRNARASSRFVEDGSYMRVKNIIIGYTIPTATLNTITNGYVSRLRIYFLTQNPLTFTKYSGYDPEIAVRTGINTSLGTGIDYGQFPAARTFIGGIQFTF
ncbi:SusC/RagA family TonB-linked outer membrane protein [Aquiflexum gelatinilyticum]|uniref:TonB-dependent receptor n=1 Tax=Aquiflexum gelatinilyticum TaxID=2961943 RepID=A0A9X2T0M4_9BACT|nr:TonB-dependent receptor [Aquiflexum gelatinilyticum]MCR9015006.1 TonB-dependent receptor [Aquiflexum gelatinilyticum]MCS4434059.1 TonB-dependent receptor [Aquiflexum gelatinilyticum]